MAEIDSKRFCTYWRACAHSMSLAHHEWHLGTARQVLIAEGDWKNCQKWAEATGLIVQGFASFGSVPDRKVNGSPRYPQLIFFFRMHGRLIVIMAAGVFGFYSMRTDQPRTCRGGAMRTPATQ